MFGLTLKGWIAIIILVCVLIPSYIYYIRERRKEKNPIQVITLQDGSFVEINGINVKHIKENGQIMYDSANRILYGQEQLDALKEKMKKWLLEKN